MKQSLLNQILIPCFGIIVDRELILGDRLLSLMSKKYIVTKGCSKKKGPGCNFGQNVMKQLQKGK